MNRKTIYIDEVHCKKRERMRQYRAEHRDRIREINRLSWERNKAKRNLEQRQYLALHPLASVHATMMKRCGHRAGKSLSERKYYEGRGISVCQEWRSFPKFEEWALANGYRKGLQIDRIDPDKGYSPDNCRFVTAHENAINRRSTIRVVWNGECIPLIRIYEQMKPAVSYSTFRERIRRFGWSIKEALENKRKVS